MNTIIYQKYWNVVGRVVGKRGAETNGHSKMRKVFDLVKGMVERNITYQGIDSCKKQTIRAISLQTL